MRYLLTRRGLVALGLSCVGGAIIGFTLGSLDAPEFAYYAVGFPILVPAIFYAMGGRAAVRPPGRGDQAARRRRSARGA